MMTSSVAWSMNQPQNPRALRRIWLHAVARSSVSLSAARFQRSFRPISGRSCRRRTCSTTVKAAGELKFLHPEIVGCGVTPVWDAERAGSCACAVCQTLYVGREFDASPAAAGFAAFHAC